MREIFVSLASLLDIAHFRVAASPMTHFRMRAMTRLAEATRACGRVDMVLVGAEGVVENGGIINKLGTFQIAICAKALNVPVYVAAESHKVRLCFSPVSDAPAARLPASRCGELSCVVTLDVFAAVCPPVSFKPR